ADCRSSAVIEAEAVRLQELRIGAIEDRIEADLALGRHTALVAELEDLLVHYPLRERLWGALVLALYRSRRQGDALRAYQRARTTLVVTLGIDPGAELRDLERAILARDPRLDAPVVAPSRPAGDAVGSLSRLVAWTTSGPAFVGRDTELSLLTDLWTRIRTGEPHVVLIGGEPGIGKTRLAAETALAAHADGGRALYGRCDEGLGVPYQPFVEALRGYVDSLRDDDLATGLGRYPGELVRLVPEIADRARDLPAPLQSDPATEQYRLFDAVVEWLYAASADTPLLVVLDDLHWATSPTVMLLRHIARSERPMRLMFIGTYRQSELDRSHPLSKMLADLHTTTRTEHVEYLELAGLDVRSVGAFVEAAAGRDLDATGQHLADVVHAGTAGNPFFVNEIVRNLVESGTMSGEGVGTFGPSDVRLPPAARDVVVRRVARLSESAQNVLTLAAVAGVEFDVRALEAVSEADDDALAALEEAARARLVEEIAPERFCFAHALVRAALYDLLSESRRVRLHLRVGDAIERVHADHLDEHLSELAYHYATAAPHKAVRYTIAAADAALRRLAFDDAVNLCSRALTAIEHASADSTPVPPEDACDLLLRLGRAEFSAGHTRARTTLLRAFAAARELGDPARAAEAVLAANRGFFARMGRTDRELVAALEEAIACQPPGESAVLAELLACLASELQWAEDGDRRFALSDRALEIARAAGDHGTLARVLLLRTMTVAAPGTLAERIANCDELLKIANEVDDPAVQFQAAWSRSPTAVESGDVDAVDEMVEVASGLAAELRQPTMLWQASFMRTSRSILRGELEDAELGAAETLALGERANQQLEAFIFYNEQMLEIRRWQDRLD
ncbi:MAG: hypothetical protein QOH10_156, partial [Actinomycetota bacterium]|nr:hypothetical protein [Actinomycetota bacterium]